MSRLGKMVIEVEMGSSDPSVVRKVLEQIKKLDHTSVHVKEVSFYREGCKVRGRRELRDPKSGTGNDQRDEDTLVYTGKQTLNSYDTWLGYIHHDHQHGA